MTTFKWMTLGAVLGFSVAMGVSCGPAKCAPSNCAIGCCDAAGICQTGNLDSQCGVGGNTCGSCQLGQRCQLGVCSLTGSGGNGGGGTGGGSGGGSTGGGSGGGATGGGGGSTGGGAGGGGSTGGGGGAMSCGATYACSNGACRCTNGDRVAISCCDPSDTSCSAAEKCPVFCCGAPCDTGHTCIQGTCNCIGGRMDGEFCCDPVNTSCTPAEQCPDFCRTCG